MISESDSLYFKYNYCSMHTECSCMCTYARISDTHFKILSQFGCFALSVEAFKHFTPKGYILVQQYFVFSVICFSLCQTMVVCSKHESCPDSSLI